MLKGYSKEEEVSSMGAEQIVLRQRTSAQIKGKRTQEKVNKERGEGICI